VSDWSSVWLAVIAASTIIMAVSQVGVVVVGVRAARRIESTVDRVEADLKPVLEQAHKVLEQGFVVSTEAARMSQLATAQVERVDQVFTDLSRRIDQTAAVIQQSLVAPAREGAALVSALRSTFAALRGLRGNGRSSPPRGVEEDDALFIG
jgi:uncharacterized protein YoxC